MSTRCRRTRAASSSPSCCIPPSGSSAGCSAWCSSRSWPWSSHPGARRRQPRRHQGSRPDDSEEADLHREARRGQRRWRPVGDLLDGLAFTHRKEFAQAITEAKREETRERRVAQTLETLRARRAQS
ncbi:YdeI/OmpD-associated family protein [Corallococcus sp. ZKHCc1 1396]|uniref:YdeI/OmpD-associated family protein n=1 Tax=Corallococcus soli TaxID=2710757 RepID=A0ABR9PMS2_9BACT|nr:YdeI/OmpD-associated family protein [Corallococcus soli]